MIVRHFKIKVEGEVQGVGFRANTLMVARQLGLFGTVENKEDGSVYIEVEGGVEELEKFLVQVKKGTSRSQVSQLSIEEGPLNHFMNFSIQY